MAGRGAGRAKTTQAEHRLDLRFFAAAIELATPAAVVTATLDNFPLNGVSTYWDATTGLRVAIEYPINRISVNAERDSFAVSTGPVILPDPAAWDGAALRRVFLVYVAFYSFDRIRFIVPRQNDAPAIWERPAHTLIVCAGNG